MMNLSAIFVSVVFWNILALVESTFYLEIVTPTPQDDITELIKKSVSNSLAEKNGQKSDPKKFEKGFTVELHQCVAEWFMITYQIECERVAAEERLWAYTTVNFNSVFNLEIPEGHSFRVGGAYVYDTIPQAMAMGVEKPVDPYMKEFIPSETHASINKVHLVLRRLMDSKEESDTIALQQFYSINHRGYFAKAGINPRQAFEKYIALLQKVIDVSGYTAAPGSPVRSPSWTPPQPSSPSASSSQSPPRKRLKSMRQSVIQSITGVLNSVLCRRKSSSRVHTEMPTKYVPRLSEAEILEAAILLAFKMIDPCHDDLLVHCGPKKLEAYCATQCQFLGATVRIYPDRVSEGCEKIKTGFCEQGMCVCGRSAPMVPVTMVNCNNALRLHVYQHLRPRR